MKHKWVEDGVSMHNGQYYYKCTVCGKTDWIASYGTLDQLDNGRDCPVDLNAQPCDNTHTVNEHGEQNDHNSKRLPKQPFL